MLPAPSDRTTGTMVRPGSASPGLSARIAGSDQFVICWVKILAIVSPDSRRFVTLRPLILRLYMNDRPPATKGIYPKALSGGGSSTPPSVRPYGISETAKSTCPNRKSLRPAEEPFPAKLTTMPSRLLILRRHWSSAFWLQVEPEPLIGTNACALALGARSTCIPNTTASTAISATSR